MSTGLHISISAETLFHVGPLAVTNSIFTSVLVSIFILVFALIVRLTLTSKGAPGKLQNFVELIIESIYSMVQGVTDDHKKTEKFFPLLVTFFLFILLNNWSGLLPGVGTIGIYKDANGESSHVTFLKSDVSVAAPVVQASEDIHEDVSGNTDSEEPMLTMEGEESAEHVEEESHSNQKFVPIFRPGTADLNTTLALALISVFVTQMVGLSYLGLGYLKKFINFSSPIMFFVGLLELVSEFAKIISFAFRLFGNIFAGEVLLVVITFLIPIIAPMPFYGLEIFVGFIQALVFILLSVVFFNMATISHDEH